MARRNEIEGMRELERTIKQLGQLPQKCVTKAARSGARIALKAAKKDAPVEYGDLQKGIVLKGEKRTVRGKKVFQVTFDRGMNDIFVKSSSDGTKRYYYPASQEYGFMTRDGGYVPGLRYMRNSIDNNKKQIEKATVDVLAKEIDKLR